MERWVDRLATCQYIVVVYGVRIVYTLPQRATRQVGINPGRCLGPVSH